MAAGGAGTSSEELPGAVIPLLQPRRARDEDGFFFCFSTISFQASERCAASSSSPIMIEFNSDPSARSDVRRFVVAFRIGMDQRGLRAGLGRYPDCDVPVVVMIVRKHRKYTLAGEKCRLAVRQLLARLRHREAKPSYSSDMVVTGHGIHRKIITMKLLIFSDIHGSAKSARASDCDSGGRLYCGGRSGDTRSPRGLDKEWGRSSSGGIRAGLRDAGQSRVGIADCRFLPGKRLPSSSTIA